MKRLHFLLVSLMCFFIRSAASEVDTIQYWIDSAESVNTDQIAEDSYSKTIDVKSLTDGVHIFSCRVKDKNGNWSVPTTSLFYKDNSVKSTSVDEIEYWIDNTTDRHKGTLQNGIFSSTLNFSSIPEGIHFLSYRVSDKAGKWSVPHTSLIIKDSSKYASAVTEIEYWIDNTTDRHTGTLQNGIFSSTIDFSQLRNGSHIIWYRLKDNNGKWSSPRSHSFIKDSDSFIEKRLTEYEYWINGDEEKKKTEKIDAPVSSYQGPLTLDIDYSQLKQSDEDAALIPDGYGKYQLGYRNELTMRFKDDYGRWGFAHTDAFAVELKGLRPNISAIIDKQIANQGNKGWVKFQNGNTYVNFDYNTYAGHYLNDELPYYKLSNDYNGWNGGMSQTIEGLPEGNYLLGVRVRGDSDITATLSVNDMSIDLPLCGFEGGTVWEEAEEGSEIKNRNNGKGFGWNYVYLPFTTIGNPIEIRVNADASLKMFKTLQCADFELYKINSSSLKIKISDLIDLSLLEDKKFRIKGEDFEREIPIGSLKEYLVDFLPQDTDIVITIEDNFGQIFWKHEVASDESEILVDAIAAVKSVELKVLTPEGTDFTDSVNVIWTTDTKRVIASDAHCRNAVEGNTLYYSLELGKELGTKYLQPSGIPVIISANTNIITHILQAFEEEILTGRTIYNSNPVANASIKVTQILNGKYKSERTTISSEDGNFEIKLPSDSCSVQISCNGYYDKRLELSAPLAIGDIELDRIATRQIGLNISVQELSSDQTPKELTSWLGSTDKLKFRVVNYSKNDAEMAAVCQYGSLYVEDAEDGDLLLVEMTHQDNQYVGSSCILTFDSSTDMAIDLTLTSRGALSASVVESDNSATDYLLYNSNGQYVASASSTGIKGVRFSGLESGDYTILAIGKSMLMSMFANLADLENAGLKQGRDYLSYSITIADALTTEVELGKVPELDESLFYYTTENTSFSANKSETIPGNYITYTIRLDFKEEYKDKLKDLALVVDIPEGLEMVSNSAIIGYEPAYYSISGQRMTIPLTKENYLERVRFCLLPMQSGEVFVNASLNITTDRQLLQPLGRLAAEITQLDINVPKVTSRESVVVSGKAMPGASVTVYDGSYNIGNTTVMMNGSWKTTCRLHNPVPLSYHNISAEISTGSGSTFTRNSKVEYDINTNHVNKVTMLNTAHTATSLRLKEYRTEYDFVNPSEKAAKYWYWPSYPDFTFIVDFANNNPKKVENVWVNVHTTAGTTEKLKACYNEEQQQWIASGKFYTSALPKNVSVGYNTLNNYNDSSEIIFDNLEILFTPYYYAKSLSEIKIDLNEISENISRLPENLSIDEKIEELHKFYGKYLDTIENHDNSLTESDLDFLYNSNLYDDYKNINERFWEYLNNCPDIRLNYPINEVIKDNENQILDLLKDYSEGDDRSFHYQILISSIEELIQNNYKPIKDELGYDYYYKIENGLFYIASYRHNLIISFDKAYSVDCVLINSNTRQDNEDDLDLDLFLENAEKEDKSFVRYILDKIDEKVQSLTTITLDNEGPKYLSILYGKLSDLVDSHLIKSAMDLEPDVNAGYIPFEWYKDYVEMWMEVKAYLDVCRELFDTVKDVQDVFNDIKDMRDFYKILYQQAEHCGEYIFYYKTMQRESKSLIKDIRDCLGPDESLPYINKINNLCSYTLSEIRSNLYIMLGRIASEIVRNKTKKTDYLGWMTDKMNSGYTKLQDYATKGDHERIKANFNIGLKQIRSEVDWNRCKPEDDPEDEEPENVEDSGNEDTENLLDPSGYVYEAVTSNRIEGVTATIYQEGVDDPWNATDYLQVNPQITDESGIYAWDVPIGNWQVRFNKEGYDPVATPWLPVPPPQLDINIPMYQAVNPTVISAKGNTSGVTARFDKYMIPASISEEQFSVWHNNSRIDGDIEYANIEEDPYTGLSFASKVKFLPSTPFKVGDVVQLRIDKDVRSYAEMPMKDDVVRDVVIESEIDEFIVEEEVTLTPGEVINMAVYALPAEAALGHSLNIECVSSLYSVSNTSVPFDEDGRASFTLTGRFSGGAPLYLSVPGTELEGITMVNVRQLETKVATPKASIPSGTLVEAGTCVTLSCTTPDAEIYYTLNGECPCENETAIKYTSPIVIDRDLTIKAQAYKKGLIDSAVATFSYTIESDESVNPLYSNYIVTVENGSIIISNCQNLNIDVFDINGLRIFTKRRAENLCRIPLNSHGLYFVKISSENTLPEMIKVMN